MAQAPPQPSSWTISADLDDIDLDTSDFTASVPLRKVPNGDIFEASRAGDVDRLRYLLESGVNVNARDNWDSVALYYACLAGHLDAARMLLESGAICSEHTFDGDRCHYAALNLKVRKLLKAFEARPPPLGPLQSALRDTFLSCGANRAFLDQATESGLHFQVSGFASNGASSSYHFPPDFVFFVQGRPVEAHRVILSSRSPFFRRKFETDWKDRNEVRFSREKLSYPALYSLIHFFYSDRLDVAVDDMEDLVRICKGLSLPDEDRLPAALHRTLQISLSKSPKEHNLDNGVDRLLPCVGTMQIGDSLDDLADICVRVDKRIFCCHQVVLASRSEYFKARLSRMKDFHEGKDELPSDTLPYLEEHDLSAEAFEKMIEYMYTDGLTDIDPDQAEEMFDAASRYLLFPLKRAVADVLLPHLEMVSPAELCHWLILSDMYGVLKIREYCLDTIACNFETFADTCEFRAMLLTMPPPSGDSSLRTTAPSAPGAGINTDQGNLLDDLREKWLEAEGAELDKRDESALLFDKRLEMLMVVAEQEKSLPSADDG
ncbi:BTB/POZ domain-containing protein At2g04740-like isoform X2 [Durio zibethinus]|uniref:BTB/POZ domain-containing protein At2g04740-like isoform X2 n=1 Tax=Durio zibethinus TaxID=66656 RepID=A0A6P6B455_DURZI|nr:BTB/POZ domain-containing protein At2g04740-like isoform X2 [Durio zibethinus]